MSGERKERISISLYPSTLRLVNTEASRQNRSRSNLIETIIQTYFDIENGRYSHEKSKLLARARNQ